MAALAIPHDSTTDFARAVGDVLPAAAFRAWDALLARRDKWQLHFAAISVTVAHADALPGSATLRRAPTLDIAWPGNAQPCIDAPTAQPTSVSHQ